MKIATSYERVKRQTFHFDEADLRRLVEADARGSRSWVSVPAGCLERVVIDIDHDPDDQDNGYAAIVTRTFVQADVEPQSDDAVGQPADRPTFLRAHDSSSSSCLPSPPPHGKP